MWKEFNPFVEWNIFHLDFSYDTNSVTHFKQIAQIFQNKKKLTARTTDSTVQIHSQFLDNHLNHLRTNSSWATKINDMPAWNKKGTIGLLIVPTLQPGKYGQAFPGAPASAEKSNNPGGVEGRATSWIHWHTHQCTRGQKGLKEGQEMNHQLVNYIRKWINV